MSIGRALRVVLLPLAVAATASVGWAEGEDALPNPRPTAPGALTDSDTDRFEGSMGRRYKFELPRFHDLAPELGLQYWAGLGNGLAGVGWTVTGFSVIERRSADQGAPTYSAADAFFLDGMRLVPCGGVTTGSCGAIGGTHVTLEESFQRVTYRAASDSWTVQRKNGRTATFTPILTAGGATFRYGLTRLTDRNANVIHLEWAASGSAVYPSKIVYGDGRRGTIHLFYEDRPDRVAFTTGRSDGGSIARRLKTVDVVVDGSRVRAYDLGYELTSRTSRSLLASITEYGSDAIRTSGVITGGSRLPATRFGYAAEPSGAFSEPTTLPAGDCARPAIGDFNGDGKDDLLCRRSVATGGRGRLILSKAPGVAVPADGLARWQAFTYVDDVIPSSPLCDHELLVGDFNGDGRDDLGCFDRDTGDAVLFPALAGGRFGASATGPLAVCPRPNQGGTCVETSFGLGSDQETDLGRASLDVGDHDGDGRDDLLCSQISTGTITSTITCPPGEQNGIGSCTACEPAIRYRFSVWRSGADGSVSRVFGEDTGMISASHAIEYGFKDTNGDGKVELTKFNRTRGLDGWCADRPVYTRPPIRLDGDFDGDGILDLLCLALDGDRQRQTAMRNGNGSYRYSPVTEVQGLLRPHRLGDFNGDGLTDVLQWDQDHHDTGYSKIQIQISTADGAYVEGPWWPAGNRGFCGNPDAELTVADLNGDGLDDVICKGADNAQHVAFALGQPPLMTRIELPTGGSSTFSYAASSDWPTSNNPPLVPTLTAVATSDGRGNVATTRYTYAGSKWSHATRRFLGFRETTATVDGKGTVRRTLYRQREGSRGQIEAQYLESPGGKIYRYSLLQYTDERNVSYVSRLTRRRDFECELSAACREHRVDFAYDSFGNQVSRIDHADPSVATGRSTTTTTFYPNLGPAYLVGLPGAVATYAGVGTTGTLLSLTRTAYDGRATTDPPTKGNATLVRAWNDHAGAYVDTAYAYDAAGNVIKVTDALGNTETITYDASFGAYPTRVCRAANTLDHCTTTSWNVAFGRRRSVTDPNDKTTSYAYDAFGRLVKTTHPNGGTTSRAYVAIGQPAAQYTEVAESDGSPDGLWVRTYVDGLGRPVRVVKKGGMIKDTEWVVDRPILIARESSWYAPGETPAFTAFAYDGAGRVTRRTAPDGTFITIAYEVGATTTTDELGHPSTSFHDVFGRQTRFRERFAGAHVDTDSSYDALGRLVRIVDGAGNRTTESYDSLGRRISSCDPDLGCWTYTFDALGRVRSQTDANGQVIWTSYDALGRMLSKTGGFTWKYDEPGRGASKGRLTTHSFPGGSDDFWYDFAGRATRTTMVRDGETQTTFAGFDTTGLGRQTSLTFGVDGEVVTYRYDARGRLAEVPGYVSSLSYDASGRVISTTLANGITESWDYHPITRQLRKQVIADRTTTRYRATYGYDAKDRVVSLGIDNGDASELAFDYDVLGRLTRVSGSQQQSFAYDAIGNLTYNSRIGVYSYGDPAHRHAVTQAGGRSYRYDHNGNLVGGDDRTLTWDAHNRLSRIVTGSMTATFRYDGAGTRWKQVDDGVTTLHFGQALERHGPTLWKYIFVGDRRLVRRSPGGAKLFFHADALGSTRLVTDGSGTVVDRYDYRVYGQLISGAGSIVNHVRYGGYRDDNSGLFYLGARYYDPALARFISADTVVPAGSPQQLNRYTYANNSPLSFNDPTGHWAEGADQDWSDFTGRDPDGGGDNTAGPEDDATEVTTIESIDAPELGCVGACDDDSEDEDERPRTLEPTTGSSPSISPSTPVELAADVPNDLPPAVPSELRRAPATPLAGVDPVVETMASYRQHRFEPVDRCLPPPGPSFENTRGPLTHKTPLQRANDAVDRAMEKWELFNGLFGGVGARVLNPPAHASNDPRW